MTKRLVRVLPHSEGKFAVSGLEITYVEEMLIGGQHVSVASTEFITADTVMEFFKKRKLYSPSALSASFQVALNCAMAPTSELLRIVGLMAQHKKKGG